jgi:tetratricopeptide (TPR) repeat protein
MSVFGGHLGCSPIKLERNPRRLTGLGFLRPYAARREIHDPRFKLSWFLCLVFSLSLDCWAFEEGSPSQGEALWQELMNQGEHHRSQRQPADAERDYLAALSAAQQFGSEDSRYAASLNALATAYHEQGRYTDAELYYRKALTIWEAALGPENENVAICLNNLARLYQDRGQFAQVEPQLKRALAIEEKLFGAGHLNLAKSLDFLGDLFSAQALDRQAESIYRQSLAIREKRLRPDDLS